MSDATGPITLLSARPYGGEPVDVVVRGGLIESVAPAGSAPSRGDRIQLDGRWVGPGLWDAHVHFTQWAVTRRRIDLAGTTGAADAIATVRRALAAGFPSIDGVVFGYGYRDGVWSEPTTLRALDDAFPETPVVLINGDLHSGWMSSLGAARLGVVPDATGVVREGEWTAALRRFEETTALPVDAYRDAAEGAARRGVVGIVDFEIAPNPEEWPERLAAGVDALRVEAAVWPDGLDDALARGLRTGMPLEDRGLVRMGPLKVVVDGSLNTRTAWCWDPYPGVEPAAPHACGVEAVSFAELRRLLERARAGGIAAAVHAIGDRANTRVLEVFESLGMPGTVEHAQLVRAVDFPRFARAGLVASVQPEHAMDDRDVAERHWAGRTGRAFAFGSLHAAGAELRLGSDAPVAPLDPWHAIASATARSRDARDAWHPEQRLPLQVALAASARTRVEPGAPGDLVVVERDPFSCGRDELRRMPVAATMRAGDFTHRDPSLC
ncbi:amidohydrolase [Microbacterium marinilacus]|uniref:Amidohydrolase family protein n=1 Tax=Microbacterium marinilacus TaxID=415209 RepID=A0ABP7BT99_9MICO|nr:amidohydrolase family protein [Microbacterium marinilacus]MBY0690243.1 amidohydrolase family protein [Microbacterium marinilacus]